jgi:hypothetical protein
MVPIRYTFPERRGATNDRTNRRYQLYFHMDGQDKQDKRPNKTPV